MSAEVQLSTCLHIPSKTKMALLRLGRIMENIDLGYACFQEKYYRVARAAVNESVCEDSHAEFAMVIYKTKMGIVATHNVY